MMMNKFLLIIIALFLLSSPFYIFSSGVPQPSDIILTLGTIILVLFGEIKRIINLEVVKWLLRFVVLVVIINLSYSLFFYAFRGVDNSMFFVPLFYIFNFFAFILFVFVLKNKENYVKNVNYIAFFILASLIIQTILGLSGFQKPGNMEEEVRPVLFFNNPNQLGYYALSMLSLFAILPSKFRANILVSLVVVGLSGYLVFLSGSRAALGGIFLLMFLILFKEGVKIGLKQVIIFISLTISIPFLTNTEFIKNRIELIEERGVRDQGENVSEIQNRGYDRFYIHPEYIFYGAGEGLFDRFDSYHNLEMHSGFGTVLFSYGILGLFLFLMFLYKVIENDMIYNFIFLSPIIVYNMTHQGLRESILWILLSTVFIVSEEAKFNKKYEKA